MFHIKARRIGDRTFRFLSGGTRTTRLRVHAVQFSADRVELRLAEFRRDNPDLEFVARPVRRHAMAEG